MRLMPTTTLALALALGATTAAVVAPQPAMAQKKAKPPKVTMSEPVRKALVDLQAAVKANDAVTAQAKLNEAKAAAKTDDDRYVVASQEFDVGRMTNNAKMQAEAIDGMLQSGRVPAEDQVKFYTALGQLSYTGKDYAKAEQAFEQVLQRDPSNLETFALLAETKSQLRKPAEAIALIQRAADTSETTGKPLPKDWYGRGINIGSAAKLADPVAKLSMSWLKAYPERTNWRDALLIYQQLHPADPDLTLDLMRLQRAAGALKGQGDYAELADATYIKFPNEAKSVIDEGVAAGVLNLAQNRGVKETYTIASGRLGADKASLKKSAANGRAALGVADAYASYGDYASAIEMYGKAESLGGVDANLVKIRKAAALAKSGQKDAAKQLLATVTGPRADLAKFWTIYIDHPPVS